MVCTEVTSGSHGIKLQFRSRTWLAKGVGGGAGVNVLYSHYHKLNILTIQSITSLFASMPTGRSRKENEEEGKSKKRVGTPGCGESSNSNSSVKILYEYDKPKGQTRSMLCQ